MTKSKNKRKLSPETRAELRIRGKLLALWNREGGKQAVGSGLEPFGTWKQKPSRRARAIELLKKEGSLDTPPAENVALRPAEGLEKRARPKKSPKEGPPQPPAPPPSKVQEVVESVAGEELTSPLPWLYN